MKECVQVELARLAEVLPLKAQQQQTKLGQARARIRCVLLPPVDHPHEGFVFAVFCHR